MTSQADADLIAALRDEVAYLRERLGEQLNRDLARVVMTALGLTRGEAAVVTALYQARGVLLHPFQIGDTIRAEADHAKPPYDGNTVQVHVMRIRRKTGDHTFIQTHRGLGYALSDSARLRIARAIADDVEAETRRDSLRQPPAPIQVGVQWGPERLGRLARMRMDGLTFSECARRMHLSRNACVSAANRYLKADPSVN